MHKRPLHWIVQPCLMSSACELMQGSGVCLQGRALMTNLHHHLSGSSQDHWLRQHLPRLDSAPGNIQEEVRAFATRVYFADIFDDWQTRPQGRRAPCAQLWMRVLEDCRHSLNGLHSHDLAQFAQSKAELQDFVANYLPEISCSLTVAADELESFSRRSSTQDIPNNMHRKARKFFASSTSLQRCLVPSCSRLAEMTSTVQKMCQVPSSLCYATPGQQSHGGFDNQAQFFRSSSLYNALARGLGSDFVKRVLLDNALKMKELGIVYCEFSIALSAESYPWLLEALAETEIRVPGVQLRMLGALSGGKPYQQQLETLNEFMAQRDRRELWHLRHYFVGFDLVGPDFSRVSVPFLEPPFLEFIVKEQVTNPNFGVRLHLAEVTGANRDLTVLCQGLATLKELQDRGIRTRLGHGTELALAFDLAQPGFRDPEAVTFCQEDILAILNGTVIELCLTSNLVLKHLPQAAIQKLLRFVVKHDLPRCFAADWPGPAGAESYYTCVSKLLRDQGVAGDLRGPPGDPNDIYAKDAFWDATRMASFFGMDDSEIVKGLNTGIAKRFNYRSRDPRPPFSLVDISMLIISWLRVWWGPDND